MKRRTTAALVIFLAAATAPAFAAENPDVLRLSQRLQAPPAACQVRLNSAPSP